MGVLITGLFALVGMAFYVWLLWLAWRAVAALDGIHAELKGLRRALQDVEARRHGT